MLYGKPAADAVFFRPFFSREGQKEGSLNLAHMSGAAPQIFDIQPHKAHTACLDTYVLQATWGDKHLACSG